MEGEGRGEVGGRKEGVRNQYSIIRNEGGERREMRSRGKKEGEKRREGGGRKKEWKEGGEKEEGQVQKVFMKILKSTFDQVFKIDFKSICYQREIINIYFSLTFWCPVNKRA